MKIKINKTVQFILILTMVGCIGLMAEFIVFNQFMSELDKLPISPANASEVPLNASSEAVDPNVCAMPNVDCPDEKAETYEVSCYTGYESHGANGRNDGVSVATYQFPQGKWIEIEGIGKRRVDTVTAKSLSHRIDVWFGETQEDYQRCIQFGVKKLKVTS